MSEAPFVERRCRPREDGEVARAIARLRAEMAVLRAGNELLRRTVARYWARLQERRDVE